MLRSEVRLLTKERRDLSIIWISTILIPSFNVRCLLGILKQRSMHVILKKVITVVSFKVLDVVDSTFKSLIYQHNIKADFMEVLQKGLQGVLDKAENKHKTTGDHFSSCYSSWAMNGDQEEDPTYKTIPIFYRKLSEYSNSLPNKLREEALKMSLQRKGEDIQSNEELMHLYNSLLANRKECDQGETISYEEIKSILVKASSTCRQLFTARSFCKLMNAESRANVKDLFNYALRKTWHRQTRIGLSQYDSTGQGYLREHEMEMYILDMIPSLCQLEGLHESFYPFYICTATRKFVFFLDPNGTGHIRISDILVSGFLDDVLQLRDANLPLPLQEDNWFCAPSALRVYGEYLNLDKDHNGMLSKEELAALGIGTLTRLFLDRLFQECQTYGGEMDYKAYLDLVLALENVNTPQAKQYFFKILDLKGQGYLDSFTLHYFFRGVREKMKEFGQEPVQFEDIKDEIYDMIKPKDPYKITLQDFQESDYGGEVISLLIDLNGLWNHENRD